MSITKWIKEATRPIKPKGNMGNTNARKQQKKSNQAKDRQTSTGGGRRRRRRN